MYAVMYIYINIISDDLFRVETKATVAQLDLHPITQST